MTRSISLRSVLFASLGTAALIGTLPSPAQADERDNRYREQERREQGRQHARAQQQWREAHRYDGYYRRPDVYYSAPPVIHQPPAYYQQPGASMYFSFPFY